VNAFDYDGDQITYSISSTPVSNITIDEATGLIIWEVGIGQTGEYIVAIQVSDGIDTSRETFDIRVIDVEEESDNGMFMIIIGIIIFVLSVIVIFAVILFLLYRHHSKRSEQEVETSIQDPQVERVIDPGSDKEENIQETLSSSAEMSDH